MTTREPIFVLISKPPLRKSCFLDYYLFFSFELIIIFLTKSIRHTPTISTITRKDITPKTLEIIKVIKLLNQNQLMPMLTTCAN